MNNKGKIICKRIISYDEIILFLKTHSIDEAVNILLKSEQDEWKKHNKTKIYNEATKSLSPNPKFFIDCFPRWEYHINDKKYLKEEIKNNNLFSKIIWEIETKIEYDAKLKAYNLLKKGT